MSVQGVSGVSDNQQVQSGAEQQTVGDHFEQMDRLLQQQEEESQSLIEMIHDAQEKAKAQRDALKVPKNTHYVDAPLEAYARLARAKDKAQVNAASGFARRKIAQLKSALRTDGDNAIRIKGSIRQLEKAISRGERKKRELDRERLAKLRKARSEEQKKRNEQELNRRKTQRMIRESGYMREAEIAGRLDSHLTATQMELRQQSQQLAASTADLSESAAQQYYTAAAQMYTATAASAAVPEAAAPAGELNVAG